MSTGTQSAWHACSDAAAHRAKTDAVCPRRAMLHKTQVLTTWTSEDLSLELLKGLKLPVQHSALYPPAVGRQRMLYS